MHDNRLKVIAYIALALGLAVLVFFINVMVSTYDSVGRSAQVVLSEEPEPTNVLTQEEPEVVDAPIEPSQTVEAPTEAPVVSQRASEPVQEPAPVVTPYAAEMSAAGIAPADHAIAAQLLLIGTDWIQPGNSYVISHVAREIDTIKKFEVANRLVKHLYGTWSGALLHTQNNAGRW